MDKIELQEAWCFDFLMKNKQERQFVYYEAADELFSIVATGWAEERDYGIGGSFGTTRVGDNVKKLAWHFRFGLCNQKGKYVSYEDAEVLMNVMLKWANSNGFMLEGHFRKYTYEEGLPIPLK